MARVLLIDDDPAVGSANQAALSAAGHEVSLVASAADGLAAAGSFAPQAVVLEVWLDGAPSGVELCRELERRLPRVPVIVLTRYDDHLDAAARRRQDRDGGWIAADLYLQKPVAPALLVDQVEHALVAVH